jgi:hypothetical protein
LFFNNIKIDIGLFEQQDQLAIDKINKYSKLLNQTAEKTGKNNFFLIKLIFLL